ncbi:MAG: GntP family permease [Phycisphaerae bacterium]|nr:GntP family permease [Phycisphaerae bacterium]
MLLIALLVVSIVLIVVSTVRFQLHPFLALIFVAIGFGLLSGMDLGKVADSINSGFGDTLSKIGIVIIAGVIMGTFLERSGGAFAIAEKTLRVVGQRHVPLAMAIIGYIVSIPVFADSGFVILAPLNRALAKRARISLAGAAIALAAGLTATHCLVPPTPGPIAAAGILGADLGLVILFGLAVSAVATAVGWAFASRFASKVYIDPNPELTEADVEARLREAPSAWKALTPILLPMGLIVLKSISDFPTHPFGEGSFRNTVAFIGEPVIALLIGTVLAFRLPRKLDRQMLSTTGWVGQAMLDSAIIIMITGAGGSFGTVLRNSPIADVLSRSLSQAHLGLFLPFIIAAALKTAQGSSTVALITTASLMTPLMSPLGFESAAAKALVVMSISAGAMVVSHANDSFFWVVTQMSRMDVKTGYRLHTVSTLLMGAASVLTVWVLGLILL